MQGIEQVAHFMIRVEHILLLLLHCMCPCRCPPPHPCNMPIMYSHQSAMFDGDCHLPTLLGLSNSGPLLDSILWWHLACHLLPLKPPTTNT